MQKQYFVLITLFLFFLYGCTEEKPEYFKLGKNSFDKENYSLARNQFSTIKPDHSDYKQAQDFIKIIDSIEKSKLLEISKNDSIARVANNKLLGKYAGNYKIEVKGTSSEKQVEVYILNIDGTAEWLWVEYANKKSYIDDRKSGTWKAIENSLTINIVGNSGTISETYIEKNGLLINKQLSKRRLEKTNESFR